MDGGPGRRGFRGLKGEPGAIGLPGEYWPSPFEVHTPPPPQRECEFKTDQWYSQRWGGQGVTAPLVETLPPSCPQ